MALEILLFMQMLESLYDETSSGIRETKALAWI